MHIFLLKYKARKFGCSILLLHIFLRNIQNTHFCEIFKITQIFVLYLHKITTVTVCIVFNV